MDTGDGLKTTGEFALIGLATHSEPGTAWIAIVVVVGLALANVARRRLAPASVRTHPGAWARAK